MPNLSIITINYNNLEGFKKTLDSVFEQNYQEFEYIVIDGGSTDGSRELIEQNAGKFTYWVSEIDRGIYNAMNKGWKQATGEYCLFLNSGDYLYSNTTINEIIGEKIIGYDFAIGDALIIDKEKVIGLYSTDDFSLYRLSYHSFPHQASLISRELLITLNGFDENLKVVSDWLFFFRAIVEKNASFKKLDMIVSYFDNNGISSKFNIEAEKISALRKYHPFFINELNLYKKYHIYKMSRLINWMQKLKILMGKKDN